MINFFSFPVRNSMKDIAGGQPDKIYFVCGLIIFQVIVKFDKQFLFWRNSAHSDTVFVMYILKTLYTDL